MPVGSLQSPREYDGRLPLDVDLSLNLVIPRFEELQGSKSSPRREEVGRRTLGVNGGFLPAFFYRASFHLFTQQFPVFVEKPQKLPLTSL